MVEENNEKNSKFNEWECPACHINVNTYGHSFTTGRQVALHVAGKILGGDSEHLVWALGSVGPSVKKRSIMKTINTLGDALMWHVSESNRIRREMEKEKHSPKIEMKKKISDLINNGEGSKVEFKSSARWDYRRQTKNENLKMEVVKNIASFLNTKGGQLLIGVSDEGIILGLEQDYKITGNKGRDTYEQYLVNLISNHIGKSIFSQFESIEFVNIWGKDICLLNTNRSSRPVYVKEKDDKSFHIRSANSTQKLNIEEAHEYINTHWDRL